jgi:DNA invertase Pin-like site-specific DNA recombinase
MIFNYIKIDHNTLIITKVDRIARSFSQVNKLIIVSARGVNIIN